MTAPLSRFEDRVVLVTGAARGIGFAIARRLHAEAAHVVLADRDGSEVGAAALGLGPRAEAHALDITDEAAVRACIAGISERHGRLDGLVNNAAILDISPLDRLDLARFRAVLQVNLDGALACTLAAIPLMARRSSSSILMTGSIMGLYGQPDSLPYATAKGGLINMTRSLAVDLAPRGITVNAIAPGFIDTRMARLEDGSHEHASPAFRTVYLDHGKIPLRRPGVPDDVAGAAAFLLSGDAAYVTGHVLVVDGGVTATY